MQQNKFIQIEGPLFEAVQLSGIFSDCKTFVDSTPKINPIEIEQYYFNEKNKPDFNLKDFVHKYFLVPKPYSSSAELTHQSTMEDHIHALWKVLFCKADKLQSSYGTLIPLPHPYIVPGGRFREIYYWDSYFTSEGLVASGHINMVINMARNFSYMIEKLGHIPNGNRVYYQSRSQPPFFVCLIEIIERTEGINAIKDFIEPLEKEYLFWMDGESTITNEDPTHRRVVKLPEGILNRYWDDDPRPRPESYREDVELFQQANEEQRQHLYRNIRATAESGWDFSSRWMRDQNNLASLYTTEILPIDLNCLLYHVEMKLAHYFSYLNNHKKSEQYQERAKKRAKLIEQYFWDEKKQFYFDYCFTEKNRTRAYTLAGVAPLFFRVCKMQQAAAVAERLALTFLHDGGLVTTLTPSQQQWDKPNGWPPLHWMAVHGLLQYDIHNLACEIATRWVKINHSVFNGTQKMVEKYNVCDLNLLAGGGEYPTQDGFGWSNAVAIALIKEFHLTEITTSTHLDLMIKPQQ